MPATPTNGTTAFADVDAHRAEKKAARKTEPNLGPSERDQDRVMECHALGEIDPAKYQAEIQLANAKAADEDRRRLREERAAGTPRSWTKAKPKLNLPDSAMATVSEGSTAQSQYRGVAIPADAPPPPKVKGPAADPVEAKPQRILGIESAGVGYAVAKLVGGPSLPPDPVFDAVGKALAAIGALPPAQRKRAMKCLDLLLR